MSTDYFLACFTCEKTCQDPFASASGFHGYEVHEMSDETLTWLGHGDAIGSHECHDVRIVSEDYELPWEECGDDMDEAIT